MSVLAYAIVSCFGRRDRRSASPSLTELTTGQAEDFFYERIMYGGKIMNLITSSFCRAVARHSAPRARPGDAESTDLSAYRAFRPFKFEFHAWVLAEDDRCVERRM
jgi:hypothetical protein